MTSHLHSDATSAGPERRPGAPVVGDAEVNAELARIEKSAAFRQSAQLRRLLRHVVLHTQRQDVDRLKEIALGIEVLGRDPRTFDPKLDPIVRVEARRLRAKLAEYYGAEGRDASFLIDLPKGSYVPVLRRRIPEHAARMPSVAVLPFANFTGNPEREAFCDGLTDELIDALAQVPGLRVVARTSAFKFKGKHEDVRDIGRALDVATLLEGSVQIDGTRFKIVAQLVLAADGRHLWSQAFVAEAADLFAVQESVARDVVRSLQQAQALAEEQSRPLVRRGTSDPMARDLFDRAMMIARTLDVPRFAVAQRLLEEALARDPTFARAHGILALLQTNQIAVVAKDSASAVAAARRHLARALELDPELGQARTLHAWITGTVDRDWDAALRECRLALRSNPGNAGVRMTAGNLLGYLGRFDEGLRELDAALELDPLHIVVRVNRALLLLFARRFDAAIAEYRGIIDLEPDLPAASSLVCALLMSGRADDALAVADDWNRRFSHWPIVAARHAEALAAVGRVDEAEARFAAAEKDFASAGVSHWACAHLCAITGNWDRVLTELDAAGAAGESNFETAAVTPYFAPLHDDPRWTAFVAKHRLPRIAPDVWPEQQGQGLGTRD